MKLASLMFALACLPGLATAADQPTGDPGARSPVALDALRDTLRGLQGDAPLKVQVQASATTRTGKDEDARTHEASVAFTYTVGAHGLRMSYPTSLLQRVADEAKAPSKDGTPTRDLVSYLDPLWALARVDAAETLLRALATAKLAAQQPPANATEPRTLVLDLPMPAEDADDALKEYHGQLTITLDANGVPTRINSERSYLFKKFFMEFKTSTSKSTSLAVVDRRLVSVASTSTVSSSGLGNDMHKQTTTKLTVSPAAAAPAAAAAES